MKSTNFFILMLFSCAIFVSCANKQDKMNGVDSSDKLALVSDAGEEVVMDGDSLVVSLEAVSTKDKWDLILDEYDSIVDLSVAFLGSDDIYNETSVEMKDFLNKVLCFKDKIVNAEGSLTIAQNIRFVVITTKLTDALEGLVDCEAQNFIRDSVDVEGLMNIKDSLCMDPELNELMKECNVEMKKMMEMYDDEIKKLWNNYNEEIKTIKEEYGEELERMMKDYKNEVMLNDSVINNTIESTINVLKNLDLGF